MAVCSFVDGSQTPKQPLSGCFIAAWVCAARFGVYKEEGSTLRNSEVKCRDTVGSGELRKTALPLVHHG